MQKSALEKLEDIATARYRGKHEAPLYHYTSLSNFVSIATSGELWASEIRYLNDSEEMGFFTKLLIASVRKAPETHPEVARIKSDYEIWHSVSASYIGGRVFVISLSEQGDLLSQWRSYTRHGQGVSFGVQASELRKLAASSKFLTGKCSYDTAEAEQVSDQIADLLIAHAIAKGQTPSIGSTGPVSYFRAFDDIGMFAKVIAATFKHPSFAEEKEWRLVNWAGSNVSYRAGSECIVPYSKLLLRSEENKSGPISDVIVGPTPDPERSIASITSLVRERKLHIKPPNKLLQWTARSSRIPLRNT